MTDYSRCNTRELVPANDVSSLDDDLFSLCCFFRFFITMPMK